MNEKTKNALLSIVASLVCIVIGLLVGFIILYCINAENAVDGFTRIIKGGFYLKPKGIGSEIAQSAPLIMTGLSVAFAFKTGLFNIGAAGQYTVGVFGALYFAIILHMPWYVCLLAAMVCGAIWGAVPGIFKAYFNVNEVITSIMFNWIGLYLVNELMYNTIPDMYDQKTTRTYKLSSASPKSLIPDCGMNSIFRTSSTTIAIFIAIAIAVIIYIVLNKTTFGYELKACGFNKDAAKYAGINEKRNVVLSMTIAGALAGIGAGLYFLSGASEWNPQVSTALPAIGFNGIPVALLALSNPIGVIFDCSLRCSYFGRRCLPAYEILSAGDRGPDRCRYHLPLRIRYPVQGHRCKPVQEQKRAESKCQCRQRKGGEEIMFLLIKFTLLYAVVLMLVAMGGMFSERSGVINIALEGIMAIGGLAGVFVLVLFPDLPAPALVALSILASAVSGMIYSLLLGFSAITLKADQTIGGTALNMLATAIAIVLVKAFNNGSDAGNGAASAKLNYTNAAFIYKIGPFTVNIFLFIGIILLICSYVFLFKTKWGLRLRACGEHPQAADSVGINVYQWRYTGVIISGALGGIGGFAYIVPSVTTWNFEVGVAGAGFLALAVMIFGQWKPFHIAGAAVFFAVFRSLANIADSTVLSHLGLSKNIYNMMPFIASMIILAFTSKNSQAPKAEGIPYDKGAR